MRMLSVMLRDLAYQFQTQPELEFGLAACRRLTTKPGEISSMATQEEIVQAQQQMAAQKYQQDANELTEVGRSQFGTSAFDEACQTVAEKLGNRLPELVSVAMEFDQPHVVLKHLADNEGRLEHVAKLPLTRMAAEIARIEAQHAPHGHTSTGLTPAWRAPSSKTGRVSDADWARGATNLSESQWHKEFDRRMAERSKRVR
jgi:hypothetical protein